MLPARMSSMRLSRLARLHIGKRQSPMTKIEVSCSGEIRSMSLQRSVRLLLVEKIDQLRGPRIADRAVEGLSDRDRIRRAAEEPRKVRKGALRALPERRPAFLQNANSQINDVEDHDGIGGKEIVLDVD